MQSIEDAMATALEEVNAIKATVSGESDKLKTAVAAFVAMGWTEEEARKIVDDTLRDAAPQGSG